MIHRFTLDGMDRGQFDHGVQGLAAAQLPPAAFDPRKRINLQDPAFDSTKPATWGYPPILRRVFGLGVYNSRLYYAVASGLRIWSVAIMPDGSFGTDARIEIAVPPGPQSGAEISAIAFDRAGRMLLAERDPPTGAYDYNVLATPTGGRSLRFSAKQPGENRTPFYWRADGDYALGFPPNFTNGNGGLALGYGYDSAGNIDRGSCGDWLWTTGEQLRLSRDRSIASRLRADGAEAVNGLQGDASELVRPQNAPPFNSYFMSYIDPAEQPGLMGQIGGMAIWQTCPRAASPETILPETLAGIVELCPRGYEDVRDQCVPTPCKPDERYRDGKCVHECAVLQRSLRGECCPQGTTFDGRRCVPPRGPDLTIVKKKFPRCITDCDYEIVVTNNGPGNYNGELIVGDVASLGQLSTANANGWVCTSSALPNGNSTEVCRRPNTNLAPGQSAPPLIVHLNSGTTRGTLVNCAIVDPRGDGNTSNNISCTPPERRKPDIPKLTIEKIPPKSCFNYSAGSVPALFGGAAYYLCKFIVAVKNEGTVPASGASFTDTPTIGRIVNLVPTADSPPQSWLCNDPSNTPTLTCHRAPGSDIPAGETRTIEVDVAVPGSQATSGLVENCAVINQVSTGNPGGQLTVPGGVNLSSQAGQQLSNQIQQQPNLTAPGGTNSSLLPGQAANQGGPLPVPGGINPSSPAGQQLDNALLPQRSCKTVQVGPPLGATPPPPPPPPPPPTTVCADGRPRNSDGNCPPTTTSCPFPTFLVNGTCCTREALTARTCGGTTTTSCPAGARMGLNGQCFFVDPGCQGKDCPPPGTGSQPTCQFPKLLIGGQCVCRGGTVGDDCHVPTDPACHSPKMLINGQCVCRPGTEGDDCHVPTKGLCPNGKPKKDGQCPTTPECTGGKSFDGSVCRCKFGMTEGKNGQCVRSEGDSKKTKDKTCGRGTHLVNGECVRGSPNLNQKNNKSSGNQLKKAGPGVNTAPLLHGIGQGGTTKPSGGSKGKGN